MSMASLVPPPLRRHLGGMTQLECLALALSSSMLEGSGVAHKRHMLGVVVLTYKVRGSKIEMPRPRRYVM